MRILAVDDDPTMIELLEVMLLDLGYTDVTLVSDGHRVMKQFDGTSEFDCILLDINMPKITGIELCRLIRSDARSSDIPVVMMTALRDQKSADAAFRAGAIDYVNKPFDMIELEMRLRSIAQLNEKRHNKRVNKVEYPPLNLKSKNGLEKIKLDEIDDLIDYTALCNYLTHLSLAGLESRQVVAVKLMQFGYILERTSPQELSFLLSEIAGAIASEFHKYDCMVAYCGDGAFLVVTDKSRLEASVQLEESVSNALNEKALEFDDGLGVFLDVAISNPIRPNTSKKQRVRKTFDRAVGRAELRLGRKANMGGARTYATSRGLRLVVAGSADDTFRLC